MDDEVATEFSIRRTLSAYCHHVDDGRFDKLIRLWTPRGVFMVDGDEVCGHRSLKAWFERRQPPDRRGKHLTMNTAAEVDGDRATAVSDFLFLRFVDGALTPAVTGRYLDVLVLVGGSWRFERREVQKMGPQRPTD